MIKIKSKNIASIFVFLGIVLTLSVMGYKILSNGVYSPSLTLGKIQIDGLYLRLNNKLILSINEINLSALQASQALEEEDDINADEVLTWIKRFLFVLSYFEQIDIENIVLNDNHKRSVHYDGVEYSINTPKVLAKFAVANDSKATQLHITQLEIIRFGIQIQGNLSYQGVKKTLEMDIAISPKEPTNDVEQPTLYIRAITDFYKIDLEASSSHLYNLESIKPFITKLKNKTLNDWLFKNVHYDVLKLHALRFQSTFDKYFFTKLQKTLELDLAIESPKIYLAPHLQPITATRIIVYMRDENLHFLPKEPFFANTNLEDSSVTISNIFTQPLGVKISIASQNAALSDELAKLLEVYDVKLPIRSVDSTLNIKLDIDVQNNKKGTNVWLNGNIGAPHTTLVLGNQRLILHNLQLVLAHKATQGYIQILNTKVDYAKSIQGTLNVLWNLQDSTLNGNFLIDKFALNSTAFTHNIETLKIPEGSDELTQRIIQAIYEDSKKGMSEDILHIDANELKKITFTGNLGGEHKNITLPDFGLNINIGDSSIFELSDIAKIYRYSPMLRFFEIPKGYIKIQTKDFETFAINGEVEDLKYPLYDKTGKKLSHYVLEGVINPKGIFIGSQDKKFRFIKEGNIVKLILDGYNLRIDEVFSSSVPLLAQINQENEVKESLTPEQRQEQEAFLRAKQSYEQKNNISPHITYVEAANMDFYLQDYMIPSDFASIAIRDGLIRADITYGNGVANVDMAYSQANLRLSNFSDKFLNQVWQRDIFSGGLFNFKGVYNDGALKGQISVQNTTYNDLSIVQNILALIDTIPALLTFRKPGLGANGYEIKKGTIDFMINNEFLVLENIDLVGSSIDVEGGGLVKLNTKELDVVLKASTLKRLADIIDKIPLFDYVILGDDGKFATGIVMKGTLDNPKSEVSVAEDILFSPFEMVGRILKPVDNFLGNLSNALESGVESLPIPEKERSINIPDTPMEPEQDSQKIDTQQPALEEKELDSLLNEPNLPQEEEEALDEKE